MRLITVQHKSILKSLNDNQTYKADIAQVTSPNLIKPYKFMTEEYKYDTCPIFLCSVGLKAEFYGAKFDKDHIAFEFDIPDSLIKSQVYYDWTDLIFFTEFTNMFHDTYDKDIFPTINDFMKYVLSNQTTEENKAYQFTVNALRNEWLKDTCYDLSKLDKMHNGSGGSNILKPLSYYK